MKQETKTKLRRMLMEISPKEERDALLLDDNKDIRNNIVLLKKALEVLSGAHENSERRIISYVEKTISEAKGEISTSFDDYKSDLDEGFSKLEGLWEEYDKKSEGRSESVSKGLKGELQKQIDSFGKELGMLSQKMSAGRQTTWGGASIITYLNGSTISPQNLYNQINWIFGSGFTVSAVNNNQTQQVDVTITTTGGGGTSPNFADRIIPTGPVNGTNAVFSLPQAPSPALSLCLYVNGQLQLLGVDYNLTSPTVITFAALAIPGAGSLLQAFYRF